MGKRKRKKKSLNKRTRDYINEQIGMAINSHTESWYKSAGEIKESIRRITIYNIVVMFSVYALYDLIIKIITQLWS